ncbi:MAG: hypothetical protein ACTSYF_14240 [Promethearchaeota archaeon]
MIRQSNISGIANVPDWEDIEDFTKGLQYSLDEISETEPKSVEIRVRIARTIAMMRDEKRLEQDIKLVLHRKSSKNYIKLKNLIIYSEPPVFHVI